MISYLPLSHIAAQMMDIHAQLSTGLTIHFAQPDAMKGSLKDTIKACDFSLGYVLWIFPHACRDLL